MHLLVTDSVAVFVCRLEEAEQLFINNNNNKTKSYKALFSNQS